MMCLILQGTRVQVQVLKPCKFVQESRIKWRCIYRDLKCEAWQLYLSRITKINFLDLVSCISMCMCLGFPFSQPQTYIRIILRVISVDETRWKGFMQAYYDQRQFALVYLSLEEVAAFVHCRVL